MSWAVDGSVSAGVFHKTESIGYVNGGGWNNNNLSGNKRDGDSFTFKIW